MWQNAHSKGFDFCFFARHGMRQIKDDRQLGQFGGLESESG
jgi:hypothetical protein